MLTASQIAALSLLSEQLLDPIVEFLLKDISQRVSEAGQLTSTAAYQIWRTQNLGVSQRKIKEEIAKRLKVSLEEAEKLLTQAAEVGYNFDIDRLPTSHAIPLVANSSLQQVLEATVKLAKEDLTNITQTIGFVGHDGRCRELTQAYNQACDFAFQKVTTGAQDYISAARDATRELVNQGIRTIDYESGVHTSVEAATRRNIMGGLGLMQEQISQKNHDLLGCDGWEISAHAGSAPDHEPIQGKQYSDEEYTSLNNSLVRRIGTLNCGHAASPIILGVNSPQYTEEELEKFRKDNEEGVTIDGRHYTQYEATQRQRKIERAIRKQKNKILVDEGLGDKDKLQTDQIRYRVLEQEYKRFSKAAGLRVQHERLEMSGFGPKQAKAAEKTAQERIAETGSLTTNQGWYSIPVSGGETSTKYRKIKKTYDGTDAADLANAIIDDNVRNTNPAFDSKDPRYRQNCQRCVPAYVMRRRGFDVVAKPAIVNEDGKLSTSDKLYYSWKKVFKDANFEFYSGYDGGKAAIIEQMAEWGNGAIAQVRILKKNANEGHVFVAERVNGVVRFVDPQSGDIDCESIFTSAALGGTMMARVDNLEPSELIELCIKNRGGKS